ncbi:MAG: hypothetical protein AMXMBFR47_28120 [Planctomycetota bacterium]
MGAAEPGQMAAGSRASRKPHRETARPDNRFFPGAAELQPAQDCVQFSPAASETRWMGLTHRLPQGINGFVGGPMPVWPDLRSQGVCL